MLSLHNASSRFNRRELLSIGGLALGGLDDKILLVVTGEMGRTPRINRTGGRDHWARLAPLMLHGAGSARGLIGQSTRDGGDPATEPLTTANLISTILHPAFDVGQLRVQPALSGIARLGEPSPIVS